MRNIRLMEVMVTCLLLRQRLANDVIKTSLFADDVDEVKMLRED